MPEHSSKEFQALLQLVDEPDQVMYAMIEEKILEHGYQMMPFLREALDNNFRNDVIERLQSLIHKINLNHISDELLQWKQMGAGNLMHGLFLIAKYQHPFAEIENLKQQINDLKHDIWIEINSKLTILEKIRVFNHVLYDVHGFKPNRIDFHNPLNSYIINVLSNKSGSPVLMASVYIIIAQMLGLPVYGVNVPEHFICVVVNDGDDDTMSFLPKKEPLFYINAFSQGALFTKVQLASFLKQLKVDEKPEYFVPCTNEDIISRVLNNLVFAYKKTGDTAIQEDIMLIQSVFARGS
jgi:regulator of sirC expression with transglutaminase-like and TPR domain